MILKEDQNSKIDSDQYFDKVCKVFMQENQKPQYNIVKCITQDQYKTKFRETKRIIEQWLAFNSSCELAFYTGKANKNHPKFCGDKLPPTAYFFLVFNLFSPELA